MGRFSPQLQTTRMWSKSSCADDVLDRNILAGRGRTFNRDSHAFQVKAAGRSDLDFESGIVHVCGEAAVSLYVVKLRVRRKPRGIFEE